MPMSWGQASLRKNDLRRVLGGVLSALFGITAPIGTSLRTDVALASPGSLNSLGGFSATTGSQGVKEVLVDTSTQFQTWIGGGVAITESSAYLLQTQMSAAARQAFLTEMFSPTTGCNMVRLCMGDSDYAGQRASGVTGNTTSYKDMTQTISDGSDLAYIIPVCRQILAINPNVIFFAAPWSPPASLKYPAGSALAGKNAGADTYLDTSGSNLTTYANIFKNHFLFYQQNGINIRYYSIQNEPNFTPTGYPGCRYGAADFTSFIKVLGPIMTAAGMPQRFIQIGDANWDFASGSIQANLWTNALADATASTYIAQAAFHSYGGDPSQISTVLGSYPQIPAIMTELSGTYWNPSTQAGNFLADWKAFMGNILIGGPRNGTIGTVWWNLLLDASGMPGPSGTNLGPVVNLNTSTGVLTRGVQYYELAQHIRYVRPGAVRIASTTFANGTAGADLQSVAWLNTDGSVVVILWNNSASSITATVKDQQAGGVFQTVTLAASDVLSLRFKNTAAVGVPDAPLISATASGTGAVVSLAGAAPSSNGAVITGYDLFNNGVKVASNVSLAGGYTVAIGAANTAFSITAQAKNAQGASATSAFATGTTGAGTALAINQLASATNDPGFTTTLTLTLPAAPTAGATMLLCLLSDQQLAATSGLPSGATQIESAKIVSDYHSVYTFPASALNGSKALTLTMASQATGISAVLYDVSNLSTVTVEQSGTATKTTSAGHGRVYYGPLSGQASTGAIIRIHMVCGNDGGTPSVTAPSSGVTADVAYRGGIYSGAYYNWGIIFRLAITFADYINVDGTTSSMTQNAGFTQLKLS